MGSSASSSSRTKESSEWLNPDEPSDEGQLHNNRRGVMRHSKCQDPWWVLVWAAQLITLLAIGAISFVKYHEHFEADDTPDTTHHRRVGFNWSTMTLLVSLLSLALLCSITFLIALRNHARTIIQISLVAFALYLCGLIVFFAIRRVWIGLILTCLLLPLWIWYCFSIQQAIPFTANILQIVSGIFKKHSSSIAISILTLVTQAVWFGAWLLATISIFLALGIEFEKGKPVSTDDTNPTRGAITAKFVGILFLLLVSLLWTYQALKNLLHVTIAGVVASWYFTPQVESPVGPSLKRACTTSLGSVLLASLITAIVSALRWTFELVAKWLKGDDPNCCTIVFICIIDCILRIIEEMVEYFNQYALAYVGIYGKSYFDSAKSAYSMIHDRGLDAVINDGLVDLTVFLGGLTTAILCGGLGVGLAFALGHYWLTWLLVGVIVGLLLSYTVLSIVSSGALTFFVCLAEDPSTLQTNHPNEYRNVVPDIQQRYENVHLESLNPSRQSNDRV